MCFYFHQSKTATELKNRFNVNIEDESFLSAQLYNGFTFPKIPVITNADSQKIQCFNWGLIPSWAQDNAIRKNTLNARIETINEKPAFRGSVSKRCLIPADGFYEWQWLDEKGKNKQKYFISIPNEELFAFAGLWSEWTDKSTGEIIKTCTILTMEANQLMSEIHNSKKRMPVILSQNNEREWLNNNMINPLDIDLIATKI